MRANSTLSWQYCSLCFADDPEQCSHVSGKGMGGEGGWEGRGGEGGWEDPEDPNSKSADEEESVPGGEDGKGGEGGKSCESGEVWQAEGGESGEGGVGVEGGEGKEDGEVWQAEKMELELEIESLKQKVQELEEQRVAEAGLGFRV